MKKIISSLLVASVIIAFTATAHAVSFATDLSLGMRHGDVRLLQYYLNTHGFTVATSGPGSLGSESDFFGSQTKAALIKFQEAHRDPILAAFTHKIGTGIFGPATRAFINASEHAADANAAAANSTPSGSAGAPTHRAHYYTSRYILTYTAGTGGTVSGAVSQDIIQGDDGSPVTAVPDDHYHFVQWSDGNTANPRTDANVTHAIAVTAQFAPDTYTLQYTDSPSGVITGDTTQTVVYGGDGTAVTAEPDNGFVFVEWSDGNTDNPRIDSNVTTDISVYPLYDAAGGGGGR